MSNCTIVVGTGIADLAVASKLRDSGKKVVVFESSVRPGGRMIRLSRNGDWASGGTQGVHTTYSETLKLINQHGLSVDLIPQINEQACYFDRKGEHLFPVGKRGMLKILGWHGPKNQVWLLIRYMIGMKDFLCLRLIATFLSMTTFQSRKHLNGPVQILGISFSSEELIKWLARI